ncbi:MAG: calcium/sodium antiporter [Acidobacteria bacterium]|nr:calcium/sodium antiporter [Acidobacteriota bacterium]
MTIVLFVVGLVLLVGGAELLVSGSSRLAARVGISPLVIGLTLVAFGTSAPEMAVSVVSALGGEAGADVAIGNVVGSNIFNVLLILGVSAVITPLVVSRQIIRIDVPIMIAASVLLLLITMDGKVGRGDGAILFTGILVYTVVAIVRGRRDSRIDRDALDALAEPVDGRTHPVWLNIVFVVAGLGLLVIGSRWLVDGAISIATSLGVSELVIGLTIVAGGTSLPEVATSIMASIRGERDIAVGNVVGSNIFNLLAVLGLASIVAPDGIAVSAYALQFDIPIMIAVAVACLPIFFTGSTIARWEGFVFLGYYVAYTAFLLMNSTRHPATDELRFVMLAFVVPLTVLTLIVTTLRQWRKPGEA